MHEDILEHGLEVLGLSHNEKRLYLGLLTYRKPTISKIARTLGVERVTVYASLKRLIEKRLVKERELENRKLFVAESPAVVFDLMKQKQTTLAGIIGQLQQSLPVLLGKYPLGTTRPKVKYFETKEDFIGIFESTLEEGEGEMLFWGSAYDFVNFVGIDYEFEYMRRRAEKGIKMRILVFQNNLTRKFKSEDQKYLRTTKFLPELFRIDSSFQVFGQKVVLWNPTTVSALIIEDYHSVQLFKSIFEMIWSTIQ